MFGGMGAGMGPPPGMGASGPGRPRKGPDEVKPYPVTLESLYIGKTQKFTATKNVICSHCKGRGGKEHAKPKQCSSCKGEGTRELPFHDWKPKYLNVTRFQAGFKAKWQSSDAGDGRLRFMSR